ncbi:MAG: hypothetical protein DCC75_01890 [Proteobacteria bacterium]|nr:MAG: hypothetical protein DCC75_01890 [Pseudomonadota bacterium]
MKGKKAVVILLFLNALPFFLIDRYRENLFFQNIYGQRWEVSLALAVIPFLIIFEGVFFSTIIGLGKHISSYQSAATLFVKPLSLILVSIWYILVIACWYFCGLNGSFPNIDQLGLVLYLADLSNLGRAGGAAALWAVLGIIGGGILVGIGYYVLSKPLSLRSAARLRLPHLIVNLVLCFAAAVYTRYTLSSEGLSALRPTAENFVAPQYSLLWSRVLYGSQPRFDDIPIPHRPSYTLEEYSGEITDPPKKNVILVMIEALRSDVIGLEFQGKTVMPFLSKFAEEQSYFPNSYVHSPETDYSQFAILTGRYPLLSPTRNMYEEADSIIKIYDLLAMCGYESAYLTSEWQISRRFSSSPSLSLHFDPVLDQPTMAEMQLDPKSQGKTLSTLSTSAHDKIKLELSKNWILRQKTAGKPFFLALFLYSSHFPYDNLPDMEPLPFEDHELRGSPEYFGYDKHYAPLLWRRYLNSLNYIDRLLAELAAYLLQNDLMKDSIIIITGDHGEMFHEHGAVTHASSLYQEAVKVPLIIHPAGGSTMSRRLDTVARHVDIAPTILEILGLPEYGGFQGRSLLQPEADAAPRPVYITLQSFELKDAIIEWPWKLIVDYKHASSRLFNLEADPKEMQDLTRLAPNREVIAISEKMRQRLRNFRNTQLSFYDQNRTAQVRTFPLRYD